MLVAFYRPRLHYHVLATSTDGETLGPFLRRCSGLLNDKHPDDSLVRNTCLVYPREEIAQKPLLAAVLAEELR